MVGTATEHVHETASRERVWAWVLVALTPVGIGAGILLMIALLDVLGAVTFPPDQFGAVFDPVGTSVALLGASLVALALPSAALVLASRAVDDGDLRARRTVTGSWVALAVAALLTGLLGLVVWGPVLYALRRRTSPPAG